jgi:hypothetical protein
VNHVAAFCILLLPRNVPLDHWGPESSQVCLTNLPRGYKRRLRKLRVCDKTTGSKHAIRRTGKWGGKDAVKIKTISSSHSRSAVFDGQCKQKGRSERKQMHAHTENRTLISIASKHGSLKSERQGCLSSYYLLAPSLLTPVSCR